MAQRSLRVVKHAVRSAPERSLQIVRQQAKTKKRWEIILAITDLLLEDNQAISVSTVYKVARDLLKVPLRRDLIVCSLMGKPFLVVCKTRMIYRA